MINRIKALVVLVLGVMGLSGCILVDDEVPVYTPYPYGSYEAATDYYHRPPRHYISHHKHATYVQSKKEPIDKHHHHVNKPNPPVKEKIHTPQKPGHHDFKRDIVKRPETPKQSAPIKDKVHNPKAPEHHDFKRDIVKRPETPKQPAPIKDKVHNPKAPEHYDFKKDVAKKAELPKQPAPVVDKIHNPKAPEHHDFKKDAVKKPEQHNHHITGHK